MNESIKAGLVIFVIVFALFLLMLFVSGVCFTCKDFNANGDWSFFPDGSRYSSENSEFCSSTIESPCPFSLFLLFAIFPAVLFFVLLNIIRKTFFQKKL